MISLFQKKRKDPIYLDHAAATPIDQDVLRTMEESLDEDYVNPSGIFARAFDVRNKKEKARADIARVLSCQSDEVIFTEGGSEANNLVLSGFVEYFWNTFARKPLVISSPIEHASVLEPLKYLKERERIELILLPVDENGVLDLNFLKKVLREREPDLVSLSYVNGEIGVIQDIKAIAKMIRHHRKHQKRALPLFHTDAVQAVNYCDINVQRLGVDLMTLNASKIYGPKKIGALYKKKSLHLEPLVRGGEQEFSLRAGTENIPAILGFAAAFVRAQEMKERELVRLKELQDFFENSLQNLIPNLIINGAGVERIPNTTNISLPDLSHEEILLRLDASGIEASMKSACKSEEEGDSHVIRALRKHQTASLRFSLGRSTEKKDLVYTLASLEKILKLMNQTLKEYK